MVERDETLPGSVRIQAGVARRFVGALFQAMDMPPVDAELIAEVLGGRRSAGHHREGTPVAPAVMEQLDGWAAHLQVEPLRA